MQHCLMKNVLVVALVATAAADLISADPAPIPQFINGLRGTRMHDSMLGEAMVIPQPHEVLESLVPKPTPQPAEVPPAQADVMWKEESAFPLPMQWFLAAVWIFMLASLPFILPIIDQKPVTLSQKAVGGTMLTVVFGGFYLFTNVILFQSVHFKTVRPLTVVECIYFMSQVITTVGYGDVTPAMIRGQVFVGLYVLGALFVIAMLISDITTHMVDLAKRYKEKMITTKMTARTKTLDVLISQEKPSLNALLGSLAVFLAFDTVWVLFFVLYPGEEKTVFQAIYMSIITLSSVGLGAFTPVTEAGMVFGAFWMLFGCGSLGCVIVNFTELMVKLNEWERVDKSCAKAHALEHLEEETEGRKQVTELEFLRFAVLHMKRCHRTELNHISQAFENLNPKLEMTRLPTGEMMGSMASISFEDVEETLSEWPRYKDAGFQFPSARMSSTDAGAQCPSGRQTWADAGTQPSARQTHDADTQISGRRTQDAPVQCDKEEYNIVEAAAKAEPTKAEPSNQAAQAAPKKETAKTAPKKQGKKK